MFALMWSPRSEILASEKCYLGTRPDGSGIGYYQLFKDGSAGYWFESEQQAKPARNEEEAQNRIVDPFLPLRVVCIDVDGTEHLSRDRKGAPGGYAYTEAAIFMRQLV